MAAIINKLLGRIPQKAGTALSALAVWFALLSLSNGLFYELSIGTTVIFGVLEASTPYAFMPSVLLLLVFLGLRAAPEMNLPRYERFFCAVCAALWLVGYAFSYSDSWYCLFARPVSLFYSAVSLAGLYLFLTALLKWLRRAFQKMSAAGFPEPRLLSRHPFLVCWAALFACYLPFLIVQYPAAVEYDAYYQIEQFLGYLPMTAHWPPFSSALMGGTVLLGERLFGSADSGLFAFAFLQTLLCTAALSYSLLTMRRLGVGGLWQGLCFALYVFAPVFTKYLTAVLKDALYSAAFLIFFALFVQFVFQPRKRDIPALGLAALLSCLLRNNGVYVFLPFALCLLVYALVKKQKRFFACAGAVAAACLLYICYFEALPGFGIPHGSVAEALSVPFQQTARFIRNYPEDVTEEEAEIIAAVLNYEEIPELYNPDLSDAVKNTYHGTGEDLAAYFKVWFRQLLRHPNVYVASFLDTCCGVYYPFERCLVLFETGSYDGELEIHVPESLRNALEALFSYYVITEYFPVLILASSAGFHTWVVFYLFLRASIEKKGEWNLILIPAALCILICLAGPTYQFNGLRYALPYVYACPMLAGIYAFGGKQTAVLDEAGEKSP